MSCNGKRHVTAHGALREQCSLRNQTAVLYREGVWFRGRFVPKAALSVIAAYLLEARVELAGYGEDPVDALLH
eukprot:3625391-Rhodomonas_salina.1